MSKLAELYRHRRVRCDQQAGKARGERYTQSQHYLASIADELHLAGRPRCRRSWRVTGSYFRGALDALGVKVHVFRVGEYKSFSEPFTRSDMSDDDLHGHPDPLDAIWGHFRAGSSRLRASSRQMRLTVMWSVIAMPLPRRRCGEAANRLVPVDLLSTRDMGVPT